MLISKLSLVIGSTKLDIVNSDILAHVVLLDLMQLVSQIVIIVIVRVEMWMLAKNTQVHRRPIMRQLYELSIQSSMIISS